MRITSSSKDLGHVSSKAEESVGWSKGGRSESCARGATQTKVFVAFMFSQTRENQVLDTKDEALILVSEFSTYMTLRALRTSKWPHCAALQT